MKKLTLAAVALLAIAGMAMAEDFAVTLTGLASNGGSSLSVSSGSDYVSLPANVATISGTFQNSAGGRIAVNNWVWNGSTVSFDVTIADGYELTAMTIGGSFLARNQSAPTTLQWSVGDTAGTAITMAGYANTDTRTYTDTFSGLNLTGTQTISLAAIGNATFNNANRTTAWYQAGSYNIYETTFTGTVQEKSTPPVDVPEPATLSLLGLGALAVVLRRKLRK